MIRLFTEGIAKLHSALNARFPRRLEFFIVHSTALLVLLSQPIWSTDVTPWLGNSLEPHFETGCTIQRYTKINSGHHTIYENNTAELYFGGLQATYENWSLEIELNAVNSKHRSFGFSHALQTIRYQFSDDIIGDDYSAVIGASVSEVTTNTLKDVTFIHHGHFEGALFASFGKELSTSVTRWCQRAFGTILCGVANRGSPWVLASAYYEWAALSGHIAGAGASFECGLGSKNLRLPQFEGYGPIKYRELNLQGYYSYAFDKAHFLKAEVNVRVLSKNCPESVSFSLAYLATFGP